ncbi:MAG TPA: sulfate ABC transporter permease subunit CysT [Thermoanaerobaculia bacterium]|nr:sulfate ABC transporter permease subunit CysT [Thermoanaerobaculia bacterium]
MSGGRRATRLPGFPLALGIALIGLSLVVLLPILALALSALKLDGETLRRTAGDPRVLAAVRLSLGTALGGAVGASAAGLLVAWVLVRYRFPLRRLVDALIDLPFALPTAIAGIALTTLWAPTGWLGRPLAALGVKVAFTPLGIVLALVFLGLPFSVRTLQPVLESLDPEVEEAAASLGATRLDVVVRILLPELLPAWLTGFTLAFARGLGEYGSVVFISGNMPMRTEVAPLLVMTKLEQYDYAGATALAALLLVLSFVLLLVANRLQARSAEAGA